MTVAVASAGAHTIKGPVIELCLGLDCKRTQAMSRKPRVNKANARMILRHCPCSFCFFSIGGMVFWILGDNPVLLTGRLVFWLWDAIPGLSIGGIVFWIVDDIPVYSLPKELRVNWAPGYLWGYPLE